MSIQVAKEEEIINFEGCEQKKVGKIAKNYIYNLIYQIVALLIPLLTAPYLARVLGPEGTGAYSYVNSMAGLICSIVMLGIYNYGNRQIAYVRDDSTKLNNTFWRIMSTRLIIGIIGTAIYFAVIFLIGRYAVLFIVYYTYMLGYFIDCTWLFVGVEDMKWAVLKNFFLKIISIIGIFCFVKSESDVTIYVFIQGGAILLANILAYTQLKRYVKRPKLNLKNLKNDLLGSVLLYLPGVASTLYLQCDKIMIELITGETRQVSFYDYSEKLVTIPLSLITVLSTVMMPRIANEFRKGHQKQISALLHQAAKISIFFACPLVFGMISLSEKLIPWYLGEDFLPTIYAIQIISPIIITNTLSGISGNQYFTATNQLGVLLKAHVSAAIGNIILNALLIPKMGFIGAAIATVFSSAACAAVQYYYFTKQIKLSGLLKDTMKYFAFSAIMYLIIECFTEKLSAKPITNLFQFGIGVIVYFLLCFLFKDRQLKTLFSVICNFFNR